ncbi:MAG: hypothetical protein HUU55_06300 [Myxococcales bacterium]|nr:hypothetical protein [Myxococcales bacterium]
MNPSRCLQWGLVLVLGAFLAGCPLRGRDLDAPENDPGPGRTDPGAAIVTEARDIANDLANKIESLRGLKADVESKTNRFLTVDAEVQTKMLNAKAVGAALNECWNEPGSEKCEPKSLPKAAVKNKKANPVTQSFAWDKVAQLSELRGLIKGKMQPAAEELANKVTTAEQKIAELKSRLNDERNNKDNNQELLEKRFAELEETATSLNESIATGTKIAEELAQSADALVLAIGVALEDVLGLQKSRR